MSDLNKSIVSGHLGEDPRLTFTAQGTAVVNFDVATNSFSRSKSTGELIKYTEWHPIVFFGKKAEAANEHLKKGMKVFVEGPSRTRKWRDGQGVEHRKTEIHGDEFQILTPPAKSSETSQREPATA